MRRVLILALALLCVSATPPPLPKVKKVYRPATGVTKGAGAAALIAKPLAVSTNKPKEWTINWQYRQSLVASNYWWNLEASTDMRKWSVLQSNVTGTVTVTNKPSERFRAFRLSGRLTR